MAWYNTTGPLSDTVISSRVRLARNIKGYPFPSRLDANGANEIIEKIATPLESAGFRRINFSDISSIMATSYVERHYVSPEFATMETPHTLLLQESSGIAIMLCEEDHLRIQSIHSGLSLEECYKNASSIEKKLDADFDAHLETFRHTLEIAHILGAENLRLFSFYTKGKDKDEEYEKKLNKEKEQLDDKAELEAIETQ